MIVNREDGAVLSQYQCIAAKVLLDSARGRSCFRLSSIPYVARQRSVIQLPMRSGELYGWDCTAEILTVQAAIIASGAISFSCPDFPRILQCEATKRAHRATLAYTIASGAMTSNYCRLRCFSIGMTQGHPRYVSNVRSPEAQQPVDAAAFG